MTPAELGRLSASAQLDLYQAALKEGTHSLVPGGLASTRNSRPPNHCVVLGRRSSCNPPVSAFDPCSGQVASVVRVLVYAGLVEPLRLGYRDAIFIRGNLNMEERHLRLALVGGPVDNEAQNPVAALTAMNTHGIDYDQHRAVCLHTIVRSGRNKEGTRVLSQSPRRMSGSSHRLCAPDSGSGIPTPTRSPSISASAAWSFAGTG